MKSLEYGEARRKREVRKSACRRIRLQNERSQITFHSERYESYLEGNTAGNQPLCHYGWVQDTIG